MTCKHCGYKTQERFCPICGEAMYLIESQFKPLSRSAGIKKNAVSEQIRNQLSYMTGMEFEKFCMNYLSAKGFSNIKQTKGSGDHGVDIIAEQNGKTYAVQCKKYGGTVGNRAVQEIYTGKQIYGSDIAVIITSSKFSTQAMDEAHALNVELWDRIKIINDLMEERSL